MERFELFEMVGGAELLELGGVGSEDTLEAWIEKGTLRVGGTRKALLSVGSNESHHDIASTAFVANW